jgi:pimeloyl-ACP methyl ester carboxylesterase
MMVENGDVRLAVTRSGVGRTIVFFNGVGATQFVWRKVISELCGRYQTVTFDFRNHGKSSPSQEVNFEALLSDAGAMMQAIGASSALVVGWSAGADLALNFARDCPAAVAGLLLVDGAAPISETLIVDEADMRRTLNSAFVRLGMFVTRMTPYRYSLSGDAIADLTIDVDSRRQRLGRLYEDVRCPIEVILATKTAGEETTEKARRNNRLWREAGSRLASNHTNVEVAFIAGGHRLPLSRPAEVAKAIDGFAAKLEVISPRWRGDPA